MSAGSHLVVSSEKANQLKDAGFPQDKTYFMYVDGRLVARETLAYMGGYKAKDEAIAAPTVGEIVQLELNEIADNWIASQ